MRGFDFRLALTLLMVLPVLFAYRSLQSDPLLHPDDPFWSEPAPENFRLTVYTSRGLFTMELHRAWAPKGVDRFYNLVRAGYYDDSRFFRVRKDFIVQFGISGNPEVNAIWKDIRIKDDSVIQSNHEGYFAFAMTGPHTRTTQIYINLADNSRLDVQGFSPLGKVTEGMDVVKKLYSGYDENAGGGMRGGKQGKMMEGGNAYLDKNFPLLDTLIKIEIVK